MLLEDEKVFACEESFITTLEKLLQEKLLTNGKKSYTCWYEKLKMSRKVILCRNFLREDKKFTRNLTSVVRR